MFVNGGAKVTVSMSIDADRPFWKVSRDDDLWMAGDTGTETPAHSAAGPGSFHLFRKRPGLAKEYGAG